MTGLWSTAPAGAPRCSSSSTARRRLGSSRTGSPSTSRVLTGSNGPRRPSHAARQAIPSGQPGGVVTESAAISILIVDDEETIRSALLRYLARKGFQGYGAGSSAEALVSVQLHRISLVLLDVHLPEKSGVDTVPDLLQADPDLAIIMLTAVN